MLFRNLMFSLALTLSYALPALATDVDPLWTKVIASNKEAKKWAAKDVEQVIHANKNGDPVKTVTIKKQLSGWDKGKPQYTILSMNPPAKDGKEKPKAFDLAEMFEPMESEFFSPKAKVKRSDNQTYNGKPSVVFEVSESAGTLKIWADPSNGLIQKRVLEMSMPLAFEGNITTFYQVDSSGTSLPSESESNIEVKIPFKKAKVQMKDIYANWVAQAK